jgi:hypothetical protein
MPSCTCLTDSYDWVRGLKVVNASLLPKSKNPYEVPWVMPPDDKIDSGCVLES